MGYSVYQCEVGDICGRRISGQLEGSLLGGVKGTETEEEKRHQKRERGRVGKNGEGGAIGRDGDMGEDPPRAPPAYVQGIVTHPPNPIREH